jgi:hypothetical protein
MGLPIERSKREVLLWEVLRRVVSSTSVQNLLNREAPATFRMQIQ